MTKITDNLRYSEYKGTVKGVIEMYWLTGFLGLVSAASPFVFGYTNNPGALWTALVIGVVLLGTATLEWLAEDRQTWEYWLAGVAGVAAMIAPFALGFYGTYAAVWTMVIVGFVTVIAVGTRLTERDGGKFRY